MHHSQVTSTLSLSADDPALSTNTSGPRAGPGPGPGPPRKPPRSREGCLTCKRRKVKCDEQQPTCSHCERLNLECKWQSRTATRAVARKAMKQRAAAAATSGGRHPDGEQRSRQQSSLSTWLSPSSVLQASASPESLMNGAELLPQAVDEVFGYASFMWDSGDVDFLQQMDAENRRRMSASNGEGMEDFGMSSLRDRNNTMDMLSQRVGEMPVNSYTDVDLTNEEQMLAYFSELVIPPILAEVEAQKKWLAMRQIVVAMADISPLVRQSILAFARVIHLRQHQDSHIAGSDSSREINEYRESASKQVASQSYDTGDNGEHEARREYLLVALFFLSYIEILEAQLPTAHAHLKHAFRIFSRADKASFTPVERQFLLWLRLLDGRAVSAGGEGLFLSIDDAALLTEDSPAWLDAATPSTTTSHGITDGPPHDQEDEVEDMLFQVLYQPGIAFYQKVQSFMGRISKIDPWHRSRGTVEDEIEVMNIGATIAADLRALHAQRPPLMDFAVSGRLTAPHLSAPLSRAVTRAFRTYLANYYASKVHLHRVAYKALPLTQEAADALRHIRRLAGLVVDGQHHAGVSAAAIAQLSPNQAATDDAADALPVNMLWPLLMLGVEEKDAVERAWIRGQILRMQRVAGNARITAQVLEEVQKRQDAAGSRADIRAVMHEVFDACFAIL